jgi:phage gp16-like protein
MASAHQLGLDDEERRDLIEAVTGKRTTTSLTWREASEVIEELKRKGATYRRPRRARPGMNQDNVIHLVTAKQKAKIAQLIEELAWDNARLAGFVKRQTQSRLTGPTEDVNAITLQEAQKVIEGLKALLARQDKGDAA